MLESKKSPTVKGRRICTAFSLQLRSFLRLTFLPPFFFSRPRIHIVGALALGQLYSYCVLRVRIQYLYVMQSTNGELRSNLR